MNLLLLLSALLSAFTGVGLNARAPEQARAVAAITVGRAAAALVSVRMVSRPADVPLSLAAVAAAIARPVTTALPAVPRWIDRRRE